MASDLAKKIVKAITDEYSVGNASTFCDERDWDEADDDELAEIVEKVIQAEPMRALLVEADSHLSAIYHRFGNRIPDNFLHDIMETVAKIRTLTEAVRP